jgi:hypothetical protein
MTSPRPRSILIALMLCGLSPMVIAKTCPAEPELPPPTPEITISAEACQYLARHVMAEDVRYQSGYDVAGRAVTQADLPATSGRLTLPKTITVEIAPALALWLPNSRWPYDGLNLSRINLGTVALTGGLLTFNNQPLGPSHNYELLQHCWR